MNNVVFWLIAIPLIIVEIVLIVKFFQIANDIRALKQYLVDNYKLIKGKDKYGDTISAEYYGKSLLVKTTEVEWKKEQEEVLQVYREAQEIREAEIKEKHDRHIAQESEFCRDK